MELSININKNSNMRVYKQIVQQIQEAIINGALKPGDKLPTERYLSEALGLARGTVNKAYDELEKTGIIEVVQGSGSYVSRKDEIPEEDRKEIADEYIGELLSRLVDLSFTPDEIKAMVDIAISQIKNPQRKVNIAVIECNPESLATFKEQFKSFENTAVRLFMLEDVIKYSNPEKVFEDYDIIITTVTHYESIVSMMHVLKDRIFKVAVSPTQETIIKIATASKDAQIGVIVRSANFRELVSNRLVSMNIDIEKIRFAFEDELSEVDKLLLQMDILIIPHFLLLNNKKLAKQLHYFRGRGGVVIDFEYQIEVGSLIYIEEHINKLLAELK